MTSTLPGPSSVIDDDDDEEEYDEPNGGNSLLGFMFGNVDNSGDLDADYLDKDAKEHLFALADKLGSSLTEIDLSKASPATTDTSEQDYDEKAEDAVNYEDIEEQYDGPEVEAVTEEDNLLPRKDYLLTNVYTSSLNKKTTVFDDEDYDEEEAVAGEKEKDAVQEIVGDKQPDSSYRSVFPNPEVISDEKLQQKTTYHSEVGPVISQKQLQDINSHNVQDMVICNEEGKTATKGVPLPVLFVENGSDVLRFSEIFGVKEPSRKPTQQRSTNRDWSRASINISEMAEDDEEIYFRSTIKDFPNKYHPGSTQIDTDDDLREELYEGGPCSTHMCIPAMPMKECISPSTLPSQFSNFQCPDIYPLDHEDWENQIIWGNSPQSSSKFVNQEEIELEEGDENCYGTNQELSKVYMQSEAPLSQKKNFLENDVGTRFRRLSLLNNELMNGTWLDSIIWDPDEARKRPKPKLIFDLRDDHMIFEALEDRESDNFSQLRSRAVAIVLPKQPNVTGTGDKVGMLYSQGVVGAEEFDVSNDKFYANKKGTTQAKSLAKKRANGGVRVSHSIPAIKLQTMKPRLSNKEIANFHRPRALWYPRVNQIAAQYQKDAIDHGPMKVILMTLSGKGVKLQIHAEESLSSLKTKASKKLGFKPEEQLKVYCNGRELEENKSLAAQGVRPNSVLHVMNTMVHVWPKTEKLPGEDRTSSPPNVFKKKSDLSVKDGFVFLMEYCEEKPLLLGNVGMGARLCTYYQKTEPNDSNMTSLGSTARSNGMGTLIALEPSDKSPFLGDISPGQTQSCLETNLYRAPVFLHKLASTDYLLVRSPKGSLSLRRINRLYVVGQQEPHMEVPAPSGTKVVQNYLIERMLVYMDREFRAREKPDCYPSIRFDELCSHFPGLTSSIIKSRLKDCAELLRKSYNWYLVRRPKYRARTEDELRRLVTPEKVCCYESMQAGLYHLRRMGIQKLTHSVGLISAMNRYPGKAIELAAANLIDRELQVTPWALTSNFIASTKDRENLERLEISGIGDPSGRGLGFSYVRTAPKAVVSNANSKKKVNTAKNTTVTGTDADLRRLSMEAAREILLKFNIPDEQIGKQTRWHRIALIRKISSEQATSGLKVDAVALSKFARGERGQRMSFSQVQQQTKERCQEIWDRQAQSLSVILEGDSDEEEANSDLDSFAGDLENLLDFEEGEEVGDGRDSEREEGGVRGSGLKMRRGASQLQTEQEMEDDKVEANIILRMLQDEPMDRGKKRKLTLIEVRGSQFDSEAGEVLATTPGPGSLVFSREAALKESKEAEVGTSTKLLHKKGLSVNEDTPIVPVKKKYAIAKDGTKIYKEKTPRGESIVCGACGQVGHMRTNKNCPKYGEDKEEQLELLEETSAQPKLADEAGPSQPKTTAKKLVPKLSSKTSATAEPSEVVEKVKPLPVKFKLGQPEKSLERNLSISVVSESKNLADPRLEINKPAGKINKLIISNKPKHLEDLQSPRPNIVIRPPAPADVPDSGPRKKIIIKQPRDYQSASTSGTYEVRKMKRIAELAPPEANAEDTVDYYSEGSGLGWSQDHISEEEQYREGQQRLFEARMYEEAKRKEEIERRRLKKKKKKKHDFTGDDYLKEHRTFRNESRRGLSAPDRDRPAKRRSVVDLTEHGASAKRRRGGEVELNNILERIVASLREHNTISYLFVKPVTKKEAPDYFDIVQRPMDLSTIREKIRKVEYKSKVEFRHDVWQITFNAHLYNDGRNPGIPPLADQLLELCDHLLEHYHYELDEAEAGIEFTD